ncbi:hypothetical protein CFC21_048552 [Triticum aestivum]|uniref:tRNA-binding domain-containing protein n=3 Tax=Triticinae TaxID=1648030 RepID=A0A9R1G1G1_WHEAT|nr:hypothetical protein CFC21_048552 [Triticum aestivum]
MAAAADFTQSKQAMSYALCKHLNLDPNSISSTLIKENDIASLFSHIVTSPQDEVKKWVEFSSNFVLSDGEQHALLGNLNQHLSQMSVLLAGFKPSAADIIVFATVHVFMCHLSDSELQKYPNILRWMDYIQNVVDFGMTLQKINLTKSIFNPPAHPKKADKGDGDPNSKKAVSGQKVADKSDVAADSKKAAGENKVPGDKANPTSTKNNKPSGDKKKVQEKTAGKTEAAAEKAPQKSAEKDSECSVSILNIQVGVIRKAWKHPSADSLLVEEIDLGDGNVRQVVSGLAKFFSPDELVNRHVVLITNVKPGKLRDVMSAGLVLCASNKDHTVVEPLIPPEGAKLGERISFAGFDGKPEDVLNPKKKQLDKITPMSSELGDDKEKETEKIEIEPEEAQEVWREMLKQFKAEAIRMQALTTQAYDVYSKRAREVLLEASEKLRIQADKAQKDLTIIAAEVGEEGQEYLQLAAKNSPDSIKDITETINAVGNLNGPSDYKDYHVGISFGTFLTVGGFLNFMLTGSTSAIRFGFVLGFALLALGISSLRSQRAGGRQPRLLLKGQAAIASVIFFKDLSVFFRYGWFPNVFAVLLSGMVATFYIHRIVTGGHNGRTESSSDN